MARYLNLGCGGRYHPDWSNIDIAPSGPGVIGHDLSRGIPLGDASCHVVYHSSVLEHLRRPDALPFMRECCRVLRPGGIVRLGVPDLERICRLYVEKLEGVLNGGAGGGDEYEWMMLELCDQMVREESGGGMVAHLRQDPLPIEAFVFERIGEEGRQLAGAPSSETAAPAASRGFPQRSWSTRLGNLSRRIRSVCGQLGVRLLLGRKGLRALRIGRFRLAGEVHHWMYDRYSLSQLILAAGFQDPIVQSATQSLIPEWSSFDLDTTSHGTVRKPDSLFMEAVKPA